MSGVGHRAFVRRCRRFVVDGWLRSTRRANKTTYPQGSVDDARDAFRAAMAQLREATKNSRDDS